MIIGPRIEEFSRFARGSWAARSARDLVVAREEGVLIDMIPCC